MLQKATKKEQQAKFAEIFEKSFGNISQSCKGAGISRQTFYRWKQSEAQTDKDFIEYLVAIEPEERFVDFAEDALTKKINAGDTTAIIFALKTKGKKRGYVEKSEVEHGGTIVSEHRIIKPKTNDGD